MLCAGYGYGSRVVPKEDRMFSMPRYREPDFAAPPFVGSPDATWAPVEQDGVAPEGYHSTSMYPEYVKVGGRWVLAKKSRMDSSIVIDLPGDAGAGAIEGPRLRVVENRNLRVGERVVLGRTENAEEGIFVHQDGFSEAVSGDDLGGSADKFAFRQGRSRETSYARDYDRLVELLRYEREHGRVVWVLGPAFAFDEDARRAMQLLVENGYVDAVMAGNALATHDLEGAMFHTALGQDIYTQRPCRNGHCNHLDVINRVRRSGSIERFIEDYGVEDGIVASCVRADVPLVLAGSIRDDGPLPGVIGDVYEAQAAMRATVSDATTVICLATMLHTIATGNVTPSYTVTDDGTVRPVFLYAVDVSEFAVNKLLDRGSLSATTFVANVQDFAVIVAKGLGLM